MRICSFLKEIHNYRVFLVGLWFEFWALVLAKAGALLLEPHLQSILL
jgi:hypothetical protein